MVYILHCIVFLLSISCALELEDKSLKQNGVQPDRQELCREVENRFTPYIGQEFGGVEDAVTFYKIYAIPCGFDVRRYTTKKWRGGEIKSKLVVCNRKGFAHKTPSKDRDDGLVGEKSQRIFRVTIVGCKARIRLYMKNGLLLIDRFHEGHNYKLISLKDREFQKLSRNITDYHKMIIVSNSRLKIGATKTYRICKEQVNGFENIGASLNDFKNFHRYVKCFIHERDGQLFVDHFKEMTETRIGFYFDYDLDDDGSLRRAIWADGTARDNYKNFGDAVSFDPTYSTNKYSMVFTPFTGVDHHKRSVTFCGALIAREDYESFNWVFSRFLQAMGGKEPEYIITDQDVLSLLFTRSVTFCPSCFQDSAPSVLYVAYNEQNAQYVCYKRTVGDGALQRLEDGVDYEDDSKIRERK
ncbi:protein FAR1-RELATED SEQUENCE 5-like [Silene latifolia]|uniref:protein FAR1-RELATED SEQUENCE 5-like n=1 Tax=Silene latifolia TaxID=37657 RepID=UPI003D788A4D